MLVRIIGGDDKDRIVDSSKVAGFGKKTKVYDTHKHNKIKSDGEVGDKTSKDPYINDYDRKEFKYDIITPVLFFGSNVDNGFHVGGGVDIIKHGFRKMPYKYRQKIVGTVATSALKIELEGDFKKVIGPFDLRSYFMAKSPRYVTNYYGLGNETGNDQTSAAFHRIRLSQVEAVPLLSYGKNQMQHFSFGPLYQFTNAEAANNNFTTDSTAGFIPADFEPKHYAGLKVRYNASSLDHVSNPKRGFKLFGEASWNHNIGGNTDFLHLKSEFSIYLSLNLPFQVTVASRVGGATNIGNFEFYQANSIGGTEQFRGTNQNRYSGRTSFYQNNELRIKLFSINTYVVPFDVGVLGLFDQARVWTDGENSSVWHQSYGFGFWISPLDQIAIINTYTFNKEEKAFFTFLQFGFFF